MSRIKFLNSESIINANVKVISDHVVEIIGTDQNLSGFYVMKNDGIMGNFENFKTLYRTTENGFQLSDDGSVYVEPEEPEQYEPTIEEVRSAKISEISNICQQTIFNGIDVRLSNGQTKHYSLKTEDQINLIGKQVQLATDATQFEYHADGEPCEWYSREDMQNIVDSAFQFVSMNTTYCNSLYDYIKSISEKEQIKNIVYGIEIPEQYQSPVYKDYLTKMKV